MCVCGEWRVETETERLRTRLCVRGVNSFRVCVPSVCVGPLSRLSEDATGNSNQPIKPDFASSWSRSSPRATAAQGLDRSEKQSAQCVPLHMTHNTGTCHCSTVTKHWTARDRVNTTAWSRLDCGSEQTVGPAPQPGRRRLWDENLIK